MLGLALLGAAALVSVFTCSDTTIPAGQNGTTNGLCTYPRSCYLVNTKGPNVGECDDCSATNKCRLVFTPENPGDYQSITGSWMTAAGRSAPTDWQAICGLYVSPTADTTAICAAPETVCIARGKACTGYCIHQSYSAVDGGSGDMGSPASCLAGVPIPPQRRSGTSDGGTQSYCPLTDDVCCPAATTDGGTAADGGVATDGGVVTDGGGVTDGSGVTDGGAADLTLRG